MKLRMDALHYALLAVLVLLVFYAASTYGLFKERRELMESQKAPHYRFGGEGEQYSEMLSY